MSVTNGQKANQTTFNNAFMSRTAATTSTVALVALNNPSTASISDIQKAINRVMSASGANLTNTGTSYSTQTPPAPASTIVDTETHELSLAKLAAKFHPSTGHGHSGAAGDGAPIPASGITNVPMHAYWLKSALQSGVTGTSLDVSAALSGYTESSGSTDDGVVTDPNENICIIRNLEDKPYVDTNNCEVYGRLTKSGAVWTLSFKVNVGGFESNYNFLASSDFYFYFQELVSPLGAPPVYSKLAEMIKTGGGTGTGGGGGGGALYWVEDADSPTPVIENHNQVYKFEAGGSQKLYALIKVPASYSPGNQISLVTCFHSPDGSGNVLMRSIATLIRSTTDSMNSTTNQRTSTNAAVTMTGLADKPVPLNLDLTSNIGQINGVDVNPEDLILVQLYRDTDTATSDVRMPVYAAEVTLQ